VQTALSVARSRAGFLVSRKGWWRMCNLHKALWLGSDDTGKGMTEREVKRMESKDTETKVGTASIRRERSTISKQFFRDAANEIIASRVQGLASALEGDFAIIAIERLGRAPTRGEKDMFLRAVTTVIKKLKKKALITP
jgi:hypothetical protein